MPKRCTNSLCRKLVSDKKLGFVRAEVVGVEHHWCSSACFNEWSRQNMVFKYAASSFQKDSDLAYLSRKGSQLDSLCDDECKCPRCSAIPEKQDDQLNLPI